MTIRDKSLQELALETLAKRFAELLGVDSIPIVWNANHKRVMKETSNVPTSYPIMYLNVTNVARNEHFPFKRLTNTDQLGYVSGDGTRKAIRLTPIQVTLRFFLKTDDYRQALDWATQLVIASNEHESNAVLAFTLSSSDLGDKFKHPNHAILTTADYPINEVEFTEAEVMEYSIDGEMMFYTRASRGKLEAKLIATFGILPQTNPDAAVRNVDGSTSPLLKSSDGTKIYPVRFRSNIDN